MWPLPRRPRPSVLAPAPCTAVASDRTTTSRIEQAHQGVKVAAAGGCQKRAGDPQAAVRRLAATLSAPCRRRRADWQSDVPPPTIVRRSGRFRRTGSAKMSRSTRTTRSVGASMSSTTSSADPTDSARSACCSGSSSSAIPTTSSGVGRLPGPRAVTARAQLVEAQPGDHGREPSVQVLHHTDVGTTEPQPCFLDGVVGVGVGAEHAIGNRLSRGRLASNPSVSQALSIIVTFFLWPSVIGVTSKPWQV